MRIFLARWKRVRSVLLVPLLAVSLGADTQEGGCPFVNSPEEQARRICKIHMAWGAKDCTLEEAMRVRGAMSAAALAEIAGLTAGMAAAVPPRFDWKGARGAVIPRVSCPTCNGSKVDGDGTARETCPTCRGKKATPSGAKCVWCNGEGTQPKACTTCKGAGDVSGAEPVSEPTTSEPVSE